MRIRTFIAIAASPEVRRAALQLATRLGRVAEDVKWVAPENLHWTLQFLGDVEELAIPEVCAAVARGAEQVEAFPLAAQGAGAFPAPDRPRTLWLGAGEGGESMVTLQAAIQRQLDELGYRAEQRRFVPHLTLGRAGRKTSFRALAAELESLKDYEGGSMLVDEVTVYASSLGRDGPTYEVLAQEPLG